MSLNLYDKENKTLQKIVSTPSTFTRTAPGLVPTAPSGSGTSKYLREDGTWDTIEIPDVDVIGEVTDSTKKEATATATKAHTEGDYFEVNGAFVKAIDDIAIGDSLVEGTNIETTNIGAELSQLNSDLPFSFGIDPVSGKYGYKEIGADTVTPFNESSLQDCDFVYTVGQWGSYSASGSSVNIFEFYIDNKSNSTFSNYRKSWEFSNVTPAGSSYKSIDNEYVEIYSLYFDPGQSNWKFYPGVKLTLKQNTQCLFSYAMRNGNNGAWVNQRQNANTNIKCSDSLGSSDRYSSITFTVIGTFIS